MQQGPFTDNCILQKSRLMANSKSYRHYRLM
jgi:hypothetical protein